LERHVRGATAGFNTPIFVNDVPGGGGKRDVHSYDYYNETTGVSVYRSPNVDEEKAYLYYDPIDQLPEEGQQRWGDESEHQAIIDEALKGAGLSDLEPAR
ncbi:MAG: KamA family radical SAM protein, partial [Planctomycetes bacterium]|nr:KamA family radical SAM protein [Planctomycetota bacterium]